jgi:hypothetical protein
VDRCPPWSSGKKHGVRWAGQSLYIFRDDVHDISTREAPLDAVFGFVSGLDWVLCLLSLCERAAKS